MEFDYQYIPTIIYVSFSTGAVTLRKYRSFTMATYFVNAELQCTGLESRITDCIQGLFVNAYSCLSFGIASVSCYGMFASTFFLKFQSHTSFNIWQLELSQMHPALMVHCDSVMATSQEKAGWRSASTMPGALSVMMDGTMQMLQ